MFAVFERPFKGSPAGVESRGASKPNGVCEK